MPRTYDLDVNVCKEGGGGQERTFRYVSPMAFIPIHLIEGASPLTKIGTENRHAHRGTRRGHPAKAIAELCLFDGVCLDSRHPDQQARVEGEV